MSSIGKEEVNPVVSTVIILLIISVIAFAGYKKFGGASRAPNTGPIATQPNPGGPPASATRPNAGGWGTPPMNNSGGFIGYGGPYGRR